MNILNKIKDVNLRTPEALLGYDEAKKLKKYIKNIVKANNQKESIQDSVEASVNEALSKYEELGLDISSYNNSKLRRGITDMTDILQDNCVKLKSYLDSEYPTFFFEKFKETNKMLWFFRNQFHYAKGEDEQIKRIWDKLFEEIKANIPEGETLVDQEQLNYVNHVRRSILIHASCIKVGKAATIKIYLHSEFMEEQYFKNNIRSHYNNDPMILKFQRNLFGIDHETFEKMYSDIFATNHKPNEFDVSGYSEKVNSIKFFKNGMAQIKFKNNELKNQFIEDYRLNLIGFEEYDHWADKYFAKIDMNELKTGNPTGENRTTGI